MSQFISLNKAVAMTTLFRAERENILATPYKGQNILAKSETFDRAEFDTILAKPGCVGLRIYYGMDESFKVHAIIVGVNASNEDMLPVALSKKQEGDGDDDDGDIIEEGRRCPEDCPPPSPLDPGP